MTRGKNEVYKFDRLFPLSPQPPCSPCPNFTGKSLIRTVLGADTWVDIETYGLAKKDWFKQFLELANGIPSHDTFARVFTRLDPEQFQQSFLSWIKSISNLTQGEVIAIDGKTLRHSYDRSQEKKAIAFGKRLGNN